MIIINLDKSFEPFGKGIEFQKFDFPSGCEPHIKLPIILEDKVKLTCRINNGNDLILLLLATDAIKRSGVKEIELFIPYLPFARQDRVMVDGEPLSVKVISNLLNSQGYSKVSIFDPHSEVCLALIDNSEYVNNHSFVDLILKNKKDYLIISPDAGAYKKIFKLCQHIGYKDEIIMCNKIRDLSNGVIRSLTVSHDDLNGKDCYIVDDICDGGGTFGLLASVLKERNCGNINLIVSHGLFTKGIDFSKDISRIYTTDSFKDFNSPLLTQIKLCNILI